jgi:hypothetical protein
VVGPEANAVQALRTGGKRYKTALEWAMDYINDPSGEVEIKSRLAVAAMPYQHPKIESIPAQGGKKEQQKAAAAEALTHTKYAPPAPPRLIALRGDAD